MLFHYQEINSKPHYQGGMNPANLVNHEGNMVFRKIKTLSLKESFKEKKKNKIFIFYVIHDGCIRSDNYG